MEEDVVTQDPQLAKLRDSYCAMRASIEDVLGTAAAESFAQNVWDARSQFMDYGPFSPEAKFLALADSRCFHSVQQMLEPRQRWWQQPTLASHILHLLFTFPGKNGGWTDGLMSRAQRLARARGPTGENGLMIALRYECEPVFDRLLELGSDPDVKTILGLNSLHIAAQTGNLRAYQKLRGHGMNPSQLCTHLHRNVLSYAAESGQAELVRHILRESPQLLDQPDRLGLTPLSYALLGDKPEALQILLESGANLGCRDRSGRSLDELLAQRRVRL